jgi:acid phosphatase type 7
MVKKLKYLLILILAFQGNIVFANEIVIGPYLQLPTKDSVLIKWHTEDLSPSIIEYTNDHENFYTYEDSVLKKKHEILLPNLKPSTEYEYSIFEKDDNEFKSLENQIDQDGFKFHSFKDNSSELITWILGDPGVSGDPKMGKRIHKTQTKVKKAFFKYLEKNNIPSLDFIIALGDNAYSHGTYKEFKHGFFTPYAEVLSSYPAYSVFGNHDGGIDKEKMTYSARSYPKAHGIYYDLFSLPHNESYYSFNRGNTHFVFLDSFDSFWENFNGENYEKVWTENSSERNSMLEWLEKDLKSHSETWTVVAFHHPPFGQTEHKDEKTQDIWKAWTNAYIAPILHKHNVDLVLMGHIHNYQRSYPVHLQREDLDRLSLKPKSKIKKHKEHFVRKYIKLLDKLNLPRYIPIATSNERIHYSKKDDPIYVIMGSSGAAFRDLPDEVDPSFFVREKKAGSTLLRITKDQINLKFISSHGDILDEFIIRADTNP